tara:strand:- start:93 stop:791 length:699 start_codon:yes stop_codon:yes gene_type:complete
MSFRNNFLGFVGVTLLGIASISGGSTPVNKFLDYLGNLSSTEDIEKHRDPNAQHCLVHIKSPHEIPPYSKHYGTPEAAEWDRRIQLTKRSVYHVLSQLIDTYQFETVYPEGRFVYQGRVLREDNASLCDPRIMALTADINGMDKLFYGCDLAPSLKYKSPSETIEARKLGNEEREDTLLRLIDENNDAIAVTVYGAGHSWVDNVERWNDTNPDNTFSLVEIYPVGLGDLMAD